MNTPYQLVSMATILRDYLAPEDQDYRDDEHEKLSDIADSLYAAVVTPDQFTDEYKSLYEKYGTEYWDKVLEDMSAIDSQLTSDIKVEELYADYEDRLKSSMSIHSAKKIKASDNPFYDKLSDKDKRFVKNTEKKLATEFSPDNFDVYNALLPYIGEYSSNTGWTGSCELQKVEGNTTAVDGYSYDIVWDDGHDVDSFIWLVNDNPRVGGDYTLMAMYAHGMPDFCDNEKDFYRAIRKVFGNGLKKIDN